MVKAELKGIDREFVELYRTSSPMAGHDDLLDSLFAALYIEPEEIAMDNLARKTGYSLASISNKVKVLEAIGLVTRRRKPGSKRVFLYAEKDILKVMKNALLSKEKQGMGALKEKLPEIIKRYRNSRSDKDNKKAKILEEYLSQITKMEELFSKMRKELEKI